MNYRSPSIRLHSTATRNRTGTKTMRSVRVRKPQNTERELIFPGLDPEHVVYTVPIGDMRKEYLNDFQLVTRMTGVGVLNVKKLRPDRVDDLLKLIEEQKERNVDVDHMLKSIKVAEEMKRTRIPREKPKEPERIGYYI